MKNLDKNISKDRPRDNPTKLKQVHQSLVDGLQHYDLDGVSVVEGEVFVAGGGFSKRKKTNKSRKA